jgi:hypothetical protein
MAYAGHGDFPKKRLQRTHAPGPTVRSRHPVRTDLLLVYQLLGAALVPVGLHRLAQ